jgi:TRAP-type mannitol/chloroaromatic compound transport system permease small subunit
VTPVTSTLQGLAAALRRISEVTGAAAAWLMLPMVVGTFVVVVLRYAFALGWIWLQEAVVWMHAAVFMLAAAYTLNRDEHVRVDIFYRQMSERRKALVDIAGICLFLLPVSIFIAAVSWDYVAVSWAIREGSREAGGLPYPFVPMLKSVIVIAATLLVLQGVAQLLSAAVVLSGRNGSAQKRRESDESG